MVHSVEGTEAQLPGQMPMVHSVEGTEAQLEANL